MYLITTQLNNSTKDIGGKGDVEWKGYIEGKKGDIRGKGDVEGRRNGKRKGDVEGRGDVKREMLKGRGCRQYIENERGWTDLVAGHGFQVLICHPPIHVSLLSSLFIIGGAGAFTAIHQWCVGPRSPYASGGVGPLSPFISGGLLCPSSLMVWWCGVPHCGSRVVVVGVPCHEGGGWLGWRVLITHGHSMMVVWWVLGIVVVVSPIVKGGGGGGHSSLNVVESVVGAHHPLLSRVVVVVGDGCSWAVVVCVPCWWCWVVVGCHGWAVIVVGG